MHRTAAILMIAAIGLPVAGRPSPTIVPASQQAATQVAADYASLDAEVWRMVDRGLTAKAVRRAVREHPDAPSTIELVLDRQRAGRSFEDGAVILDALHRMAAGDADQVERAAEILARRFTAPPAELEQLVATLRARVPGLPREQAARTVRQLISVENRLAGRRSSGARPMIRAFVKEYAGTAEALLAEVEIIRDTRDVDAEIAQLDEFATRHQGTVAGAAALHAKARAIHNDRRARRANPPQTDPTPRYAQVLAIVEELVSGRWPPSPQADSAYDLITDFYIGDRDEIEPGNLEWMYETYFQLVVDHAAGIESTSRGLASAIYRIGTFGERLGDRVATIERAYDALDGLVTDVDKLRHQRALFYVREAEDDKMSDSARQTALRKAFETLAALSLSSDEARARQARARIATLHFEHGNYASALDAYRGYVADWPSGEATWLATLRIGQAQEAMGDWQGASDTYRHAAQRFVSPAPAAVMANILAARASESLARFDQALEHYVAAASAWDDDFGARYAIPPAAVITHSEIVERMDNLTLSLRFPEGVLLEGGRRLIDRQQWLDAYGLLRDLINAHPTSPLRQEAQYLAHVAQLEHAFDTADVESAQSDESAAAEMLQALSGEPWTPAAGAASLAVAAIVGKAGYEDRAWSLTRAALESWHRNQVGYYAQPTMARRADSTLVADVTAIRDLIFLPLGGDIYDHQQARWNAFDWPDTMPKYVIVNPDMMVTLGNGRTTQVMVSSRPPSLENVLFMTSEHLGFLFNILSRLGGTETRPPRAIMETPNQPIGASIGILTLWKEFFPARPGHWAGWVLTSYPQIGRIEFLGEQHARARTAVTIGYSGCTVHLEKQAGRWVVQRLSNFWIT